MGLYKRKNYATATVSTGYNAAATSIVLETGHGAKFPTPGTDGFLVTWWNYTDYPNPDDDPNVERVKVTAISSDTLTVTRGQDGTPASTKNTASKTYKMVLAWGVSEIDQVEGELSKGTFKYAADSGTANTYAVTLDPAPTAYTTGMVVRFKVGNSNSGASTLNVNTLGAKNLLGKNGYTLASGDLKANDIVVAVYDGTAFQVQTPIASPADIQKHAYTWATAGGSANAYTATMTPAPASYTAGLVVIMQATFANTGSATLNVNGLGAKTIIKKNSETLLANNIRTGDVCVFVYDGTNFQLVSGITEHNDRVGAWVLFNGTGTIAIRDSLNVTSLTDNGTGDYTINLTTAMASANYAAVTDAGDGAGSVYDSSAYYQAPTTSACRMLVYNTSGVGTADAAYISMILFGDRV